MMSSSCRTPETSDYVMIPTIAIVGRPNVGKSTLFNRLSRSRNALVDDHPGITRDRLHATINYDGIPLEIIDTGGFDDTGRDALLEMVRAQVKKAIEEADRVILMVDGREGMVPGDEVAADILRRSQKRVFVAANKIDGPEHDHLTLEFYKFGVDTVYPISAAHGYGVRSFMHDVVKGLPRSETKKWHEDQIRVAILGRPNVGKSSLVNRILGLDRLLVSEIPGTTRDAVDTRFCYNNREYLLIDTAGIRRKARVNEKIEKISMIKAIKSLERCHIATVLVDATQGVLEQDARICGYAFEKGKGVLLAVNKWDLIKGNARKKDLVDDTIERHLKFISFAPRINLSAMTGERVMKLFEKIDLVYSQFSRRITTATVNKAIQEMIDRHPPPRTGRGRLKFFYAVQAHSRPPTFIVFVNRPDMIHFSYERFLINQFRADLGLECTPIRLRFKKR